MFDAIWTDEAVQRREEEEFITNGDGRLALHCRVAPKVVIVGSTSVIPGECVTLARSICVRRADHTSPSSR